MKDSLLKINNLKINLYGDGAVFSVVNGVNLEIKESEVLALVGASGSGKTMTAMSVLKLLPPGGKALGQIIFEGRDLLMLPEDYMRDIRGKKISMIFQDPLSSLNPVFNIGFQLREVLWFHKELSRSSIREIILDKLRLVGLGHNQKILSDYPHQLSGGMRQRVMIAQAILANPKLLIADEPTSNLDVTLQAQILELFKKLKANSGISMLLITHDLSIVSQLADRIAVIRNGVIVEQGPRDQVLHNPKHSYTKELLKATAI
jgi:ABC-type dipeptide/oligopeptide/nickel transport system ATPase component